MVDINARINWKPGMELTAQTFLELDANLDFRQQMAIRAALGEHCLGLLPNMPFSCQGTFYTNTYEIARLQFSALLPSGRILQVDEPVNIAIPLLYGSVYYLTVGMGESTTSFEKEGVPYVRPQYVYSIHTPEEVHANDVFPITKFTVADGTFSVDNSFIPPCLLLSAHSAFETYRQSFAEQLRTLSEHANLREGDGKRSLMRYFFQLKAYDMQSRVADFIRFTHEIAQAVEYFIMAPNTESPVAIPQPSMTDVSEWFQWFESYLNGAITVLDGVVLEDNTIDYEALLAQAKQELYERLNPELYEKLLQQIKEELREELRQNLTDTLTTYINEVLKPELINALSEDIHDILYEELYEELYQRLYNALYVPSPEETEFIPMI